MLLNALGHGYKKAKKAINELARDSVNLADMEHTQVQVMSAKAAELHKDSLHDLFEIAGTFSSGEGEQVESGDHPPIAEHLCVLVHSLFQFASLLVFDS